MIYILRFSSVSSLWYISTHLNNNAKNACVSCRATPWHCWPGLTSRSRIAHGWYRSTAALFMRAFECFTYRVRKHLQLMEVPSTCAAIMFSWNINKNFITFLLYCARDAHAYIMTGDEYTFLVGIVIASWEDTSIELQNNSSNLHLFTTSSPRSNCHLAINITILFVLKRQ